MAEQAKEATGKKKPQVLADRGYFDGEEILKCEPADVAPLVPGPLTSNADSIGRPGAFRSPRQKDRRCGSGIVSDPHRLPAPGRPMAHRVSTGPLMLAGHLSIPVSEGPHGIVLPCPDMQLVERR